MRFLSIVVSVFLAAACDEASPVGPSVPLGQQFTLAVGEGARVEGARLNVEFTAVTGDSRCPVDAVCILGGDALVHIRVVSSETAEYDLHTADSSRASVSHGSYRISLIELRPFPFSGRTISQAEYRAPCTGRRCR